LLGIELILGCEGSPQGRERLLAWKATSAACYSSFKSISEHICQLQARLPVCTFKRLCIRITRFPPLLDLHVLQRPSNQWNENF
jgi:hypothetical protein